MAKTKTKRAPKNTKSELARIAAELERAYNGDAWHGPPMAIAIKDLRAFCAPVKPIPEAHSIWEIVRHLTAWNNIVHRRFLGELVMPTRDEDWPPIEDFSPAAWDRDIAALHKAVKSFIASLKKTAGKPNCDAVLLKKVRGKTHTVYVMLHGAIQHNLYHTGQIGILRKAMD